MTKPNLSQSLLKDYYLYYFGKYCGLALKYRHFDKIPTPQSEVQKLGVYFEYLITGYVREGDGIPDAEYVYKGTAKERMAASYQNAKLSAELAKRMLSEYKISVTKVGEYMKYNGSSGISDIRANWKGEDCIIDIKYTSLFDDKWNDYGWHTESLVSKRHLLLQPTHYKYLIKKIEGIENIPFYFFVFNAQNPEQAKIIKTNIDVDVLEVHETEYVEKMKKYVEHHYKNPHVLEAKPNFLRCMSCPYNSICDKKSVLPEIEEIQYSTGDL